MKLKHLISVLAALIVVLIILFSFSVYESMRKEGIPGGEYIAEEVFDENDIIPDESAEIPIVEGDIDMVGVNEVTIMIRNLKFEPEKIIISPGTTVVWINNDTASHKVVAYDRLFYGSRLEPGDEYAFTFTKVGIHRYFDAVFPKIGRGSIMVQEEPLPITGGVIGIDLDKQETNGKFALLIILFVVMVFALSHGMYNNYRI